MIENQKTKAKLKRKRKVRNNRSVMLLLLIMTLVAVATALILCKVHFKADESALASLEYDGEIAIEINNNKPEFSKEELERSSKEVFEEYSKLDKLGRCGTAIATVSADLMPSDYDKRTSIGSIYPSGWQSINFWSRCHLIGYQLSAENDNERNLITGTSRMNLSGMLPLENKIAAYIKDNPGNRVLYKVEPIYEGSNLVASGVHLQALSVEDNGAGVSFNVYVFNYQPGYIINYMNGMVDDDPDHQTEVYLSDKKAKYTGEPISSVEARVKGSSGSIKYIYFTDKNTSHKTSVIDGAEDPGTAPSERGTYYVIAVVSGDNWFASAASTPAKLIIE